MTRVAIAVLASLLQPARPAAPIAEALDLKPGAVVANVGSSDSVEHPAYILSRIGAAGRLVCEDIDAGAVRRLEGRLKQDGAANVEFIVGTASDPKLPERSFDSILVSRAYHEFTEPQAMLKHLLEALKPGGRLVVIEATSPEMQAKPRAEQLRRHEIAPDMLRKELEEAGFTGMETVRFGEGGRQTRYLMQARRP